jgi:hypothetical protein
MEFKNMKKQFKAALVIIFGAASIMTLKATSGFDLLIGFTQAGGNTSGKDFILDLGPTAQYYSGVTPIFYGETWNLGASNSFTSQNFNLQTVQWGVIGDANGGDGATNDMVWATTASATPPTVPTSGSFGQDDSGINSIEEIDFGGLSSQGQVCTPSATTGSTYYPDCWYVETVSGTLNTDFINAYVNPNVTGTNNTDILWQTAEGGAPVQLGNFTLSPTGVLTYQQIQTGAPRPEIMGVIRSGSTATISFSTASGHTYSLLFTNSAGLLAPISKWPVAANTILGSGTTESLTNITASPTTFYIIKAQ